MRFTEWLNGVSVHVIIPFLFLSMLVFLLLETFVFSLPQALSSEQERALTQLHQSLSRLQGTLDSMIQSGSDAAVKQEIQLLPIENSHVVFAALFDEAMQLRHISSRGKSEHAQKSLETLFADPQGYSGFLHRMQPYVVSGEAPYQVHAVAPVRPMLHRDALAETSPSYLFVEYDYGASVERTRAMMLSGLYYSIGFWSIFSLLLGLLMHHFLLKKIAALTVSTRNIEAGLYGQQASLDGFREVGEIAGAFNAMSKKIADDIYAQQTYAALLRQSEKQLQRSQHIAKLGSIRWSVSTMQMAWSEEVYHLLGLSQSTVPSWENLIAGMSKSEQERLNKMIASVQYGQQVCDEEIAYMLPGGERKSIHLMCEAQSGLLEETVLYITLQDITEFKQIESALRHEKERVQNYLDIAGVMILVLDTEKNVQLINQKGCEIIGYDYDEVIGKNWIENFLPERLRQKVHNVGDTLTDKGKQQVRYFENPVLTKDGEERLIAWRNSSLYDDEGNIVGILTSGEDITEMRATQEQLMQSELFYRSVFSAANDAIIVLEGSVVIDCNEKACELFGLSLEQLRHGDLMEIEMQIRTSEGDVKRTLDTVAAKGRISSVWQLEEAGGQKQKVAEVTLSRLGDSPQQMIVIARDVTKKLEQEKMLKLHTRQAQMGEMISMIAHQWRQPLTVINAIVGQIYFRQTLKEGGDEEELQKLQQITQQVNYLSQTISDFRDFFKPDKSKQKVALSTLVRKVLDLLGQALEASDIEIVTDIAADTELMAYENELLQVLMTLLKNAQDAFSERETASRRIMIKTRIEGAFAVITIADTAGGIPEKIFHDIFLPYFSTKDVKHGTGLGLYMSKTVIEEHCGGLLEVANVGDGAEFTIKLPINTEKE